MSTKNPLLSIVIVSFNTKEITLNCLNSVQDELNHSSLLKTRAEIFIVDNNSSDGSLQELLKWKVQTTTSTTLIQNKENLGFAKANNQAIKKAHGDFILLLNSDTIVKNGSLTTLVKTIQQFPINEATSHLSTPKNTNFDRLGILAATLLNQDETIQPQGGSTPTLFSLAIHMLMIDDLPVIGRFFPSTQHTGKNTHSPNSNKPITFQDWIGATALLINKKVFAECGLLDENIFMYGEDLEFCTRAKKHHWDIGIANSAKITHLGSASSSSESAIIGELKSYLYIWSKHMPGWQRPLVKLLLIIGTRLRIFVFGTISSNNNRLNIYKKALKTLNSL